MTREEIVKSMSVQDAIQVLLDTNTYGTADIAKSVAIDTMCKYRKIEQIVNEYNLQLCDDTSDGAYNFQRIKEVIEDENND
jgi:hypothetical protein